MPISNTPVVGEVYNFLSLQTALNNAPKGTFYIVHQDVGSKIYSAVMHVFSKATQFNNWEVGDAVLFYNDGDVCNANDDDEFHLIQVCHPSNFK